MSIKSDTVGEGGGVITVVAAQNKREQPGGEEGRLELVRVAELGIKSSDVATLTAELKTINATSIRPHKRSLQKNRET